MNTMTMQQAGQIVAAIYKQATGQSIPAPLDLASFISVATTAQNVGYDEVHNAITQLIGDTVFAVRPYTGILRDMDFDTTSWGMADRKISYASRVPETNAAYTYPVFYDSNESPATGDGLSVDMFKINKDKILETTFYGKSTYSYHRTRFLDQLKGAFRGPDELIRFNAAAVQALSNDREGWAESMRRGLIINALGALAKEGQTGRVVHLLTEYNAYTGLSLTATTVRQPANYAPFMRWVYGRMNEIRDRMRENNSLFTTQISKITNQGYQILRHTNEENLRIKVLSGELAHMRASVLSVTYNDEYLDLSTVEGIPYWQTPASPDAITVKPVYIDTDGTQQISNEAVEASGIIGIMYDRDFVGCRAIENRVYSTPFNAAGKYWNDFYDEIYKTRFDMTEKAVMLVLD